MIQKIKHRSNLHRKPITWLLKKKKKRHRQIPKKKMTAMAPKEQTESAEVGFRQLQGAAIILILMKAASYCGR